MARTAVVDLHSAARTCSGWFRLGRLLVEIRSEAEESWCARRREDRWHDEEPPGLDHTAERVRRHLDAMRNESSNDLQPRFEPLEIYFENSLKGYFRTWRRDDPPPDPDDDFEFQLRYQRYQELLAADPNLISIVEWCHERAVPLDSIRHSSFDLGVLIESEIRPTLHDGRRLRTNSEIACDLKDVFPRIAETIMRPILPYFPGLEGIQLQMTSGKARSEPRQHLTSQADRVEQVLREEPASLEDAGCFDVFRDPFTRSLHRKGLSVELTTLQWQICLHLLDFKGRPCPKSRIASAWETSSRDTPDDGAIYTAVSALRQDLEKIGLTVKTIRDTGYSIASRDDTSDQGNFSARNF